MPYRPRRVVAITCTGVPHCPTCFDPNEFDYIAANTNAMVDNESCDQCGTLIQPEPDRTAEYVRYTRTSDIVTTTIELEWMTADRSQHA